MDCEQALDAADRVITRLTDDCAQAEADCRSLQADLRRHQEGSLIVFAEGDLHAFASKIIFDLCNAGLAIYEPHKWTHTVVATLAEILPNEGDGKPTDPAA